MYCARQPQGKLAEAVELLWHCDGYPAAHQRELVMPSGRFQLVVDWTRGVAELAGMRDSPMIVETAQMQSVMGVVFKPGGARQFFAEPADAYFGLDVPISMAARTLDELESALTARMVDRPLHPAVRQGLESLERGARVMDIARETGLSRRRLTDLFREQVGLTPKLYGRLRRFHRILQGGEVDEYFDQAHLIHEFRAFSGMTPGEYLAKGRPWATHVAL